MAAESAAGGTSEAEAVESNRSPRKSSRRRLYGRQVAKSRREQISEEMRLASAAVEVTKS